MTFSFSLFDRLVGRRRPIWATVLLVLVVYLPTLVVALTSGLTDMLASPRARSLFTAPTVIAYILVIAPILGDMQPAVIRSLRPILLVDDPALARVVRNATAVRPIHEAAAIAVGLVCGVLVVGTESRLGENWQGYAELSTNYIMFGVLGWLALVSLASTRVINQVLRLPLRVDPLDIGPFEAIGRQSLVIALAFIGGNTLALLLGSFGPEALADPLFWSMFTPLFLLPVAVFFLNMAPTQRVLAQAKKREMADVRRQLHAAFRQLLECRQAEEQAAGLAQEVNALAIYEQHLKEARSWPYNIGTLRTLFLSVLVQVATLLVRNVFKI